MTILFTAAPSEPQVPRGLLLRASFSSSPAPPPPLRTVMAFVHLLSTPHQLGGGVLSVALLSRPWKLDVSVVPIASVAKGSKRRKRASAAEAVCAVSASQAGKGSAAKERAVGAGEPAAVGPAVDSKKRPTRQQEKLKLPLRAGRMQQQQVSSTSAQQYL